MEVSDQLHGRYALGYIPPNPTHTLRMRESLAELGGDEEGYIPPMNGA